MYSDPYDSDEDYQSPSYRYAKKAINDVIIRRNQVILIPKGNNGRRVTLEKGDFFEVSGNNTTSEPTKFKLARISKNKVYVQQVRNTLDDKEIEWDGNYFKMRNIFDIPIPVNLENNNENIGWPVHQRPERFPGDRSPTTSYLDRQFAGKKTKRKNRKNRSRRK